MVVRPSSFPFLVEREDGDFTRERLRWLLRMRWVAMMAALVGALLGSLGMLGDVGWLAMLATAAFGLAYNLYLWRSHRAGRWVRGVHDPLAQALIDLVMLTVLLWASGGVDCPFVGFYIFHVALIAILGGPRWTLVAGGAAFVGAGLLAVPELVPALRGGVWDPVPPVDVVLTVFAYMCTLAGVAYIVSHAVAELRDRERALEAARDQAALEYQLLSNTLDELEAGLEVIDADGQVVWRNKRAEELADRAPTETWKCPGEHRPCESDVEGICPVAQARVRGEPGRCRFAASVEGRERIYEMMVFPIDSSSATGPRVMNLYVDRTQAMLAEQQLMLAERLASLGRVAQGVAHELNTPLATIATLAADMRRVLMELVPSEARADIDESARLICDETRRLGRITQALLAGGDLVRARVHGPVPLSAAVERARAIVTAGGRGSAAIEVDESVSGALVSADTDRLVQVLVNLLQNAVDAVREGGALVEVRVRSLGDEVAVEVLDDGPGLSEALQGRLFEPFVTTKPPGEGTGLGLYTSYMIVQAMGGKLSLEDRPEGGVMARVVLPCAVHERRRPLAGASR